MPLINQPVTRSHPFHSANIWKQNPCIPISSRTRISEYTSCIPGGENTLSLCDKLGSSNRYRAGQRELLFTISSAGRISLLYQSRRGWMWSRKCLRVSPGCCAVAPTAEHSWMLQLFKGTTYLKINWDPFCIQHRCQRNLPGNRFTLQWHVRFLKLKDLGLSSE